ncbi:3-oxoadipate enol-lactonase [Phenylobacterium sp.]|uniref:3-oxoadipate enol-lactonase n=1 Tax=Phenylobacterium sp. TaxID=1871053 RepID=UPI0025EB674D|nr:3-oxoadipate enol-lactonase [Phenylobacterium sp.]MBX3484854.1 3-oxoadipate enol-lactonase [Phenylobacterium sp.]
MRIAAGDGAQLFVADEGPRDAPAVVLLHSIGCGHGMWAPQLPSLASWRVIRPDIRGHGHSDAPDSDYPLDRLAADVEDVLAALGVERAVVCGLSLGGAVAQALALRAPARVAGLVLANTAARIGSAEAWEQRAAAVRAEGLAAIAGMAMGRFFSDAFRAARPDVVDGFRDALLATSAVGYAGCCAALRDADLTGDVGRIAAPTLVIGGALDVSTPPAQTRALAGAIPGAVHLELDAAHLSNIEQPQAFAAALVQHLESC